MSFLISRLPALKVIGTAAVFHYGFTLYSDVLFGLTAGHQTKYNDHSGLRNLEHQREGLLQLDRSTQTKVNRYIIHRSVKLASGINKKFVITDNVR